MKKILAIVLAFAFVLGLASVASAEFKASGQFVVKGTYDLADSAWSLGTSLGDSRIELKLSGAWGNATGDATFRLKEVKTTVELWEDTNDDDVADAVKEEITVGPYVEFRSANYTYKFSDAFSLGLAYHRAGSTYYTSPVDETEWQYAGTWLKGVVTFDGGSLTAFYNGSLDDIRILAAGSYAMDPLTLGAQVAYTGDFAANGYVKYALTDAITLAGEVVYDGDVAFGARADFEADAFAAYGFFLYGEEFGPFEVGASYDLSDVLNVYGSYNSGVNDDGVDIGVTAGAEWKLDGTNVLGVEYAQEDDAVTATLTIKF
ncbi:MAG: hypothetical protein ACM3ZC_12490 [Bacteroidota bacterium]